jgi:electron-transferring-flavoprotein dehydrogenase
VKKEAVYHLTEKGGFKLPVVPPPLQNHGNHIIALSKFIRWLGPIVEAEGVDLFCGFPGVEVLYEGNQVVGVRTGDKGIAPDGSRRSNSILESISRRSHGVRGGRAGTSPSLIRRLGARPAAMTYGPASGGLRDTGGARRPAS